MSGLGASYDIVEALTGAAKESVRGVRGADIFARAGIPLPAVKVPMPIRTFVTGVASRLKAQRRVAPAPTDMQTARPPMVPQVRILEWPMLALYGGLGFLGYMVVRRLAK